VFPQSQETFAVALASFRQPPFQVRQQISLFGWDANRLGGGTQEPDHHRVFAVISVGLVAQAAVSWKIV